MKVCEGREAGIQRCLMHITVKKTIGWLVYRRPREHGVAHVDITILEKNCSQGLDTSAILAGSMDTWVTRWMALGGGIFIFLTTCGKVKMIQIGRYEKSEVKWIMKGRWFLCYGWFSKNWRFEQCGLYCTLLKEMTPLNSGRHLGPYLQQF